MKQQQALPSDYDYLLKFVAIGDSNVGKTSLIQRFINNDFDHSFMTTVGVDFKFKNIDTTSGKTIRLQIWDTAGQERYQAITNAYFRGASGIIIVFDLTHVPSFLSVPAWIAKYEQTLGTESKHSVILVGNKCDSEDARTVTRTQIEAFYNENHSKLLAYFETSAATGVNVTEMFYKLAESCVMPKVEPWKKTQVIGESDNNTNKCC